jgi:hypothetical protein
LATENKKLKIKKTAARPTFSKKRMKNILFFLVGLMALWFPEIISFLHKTLKIANFASAEAARDQIFTRLCRG